MGSRGFKQRGGAGPVSVLSSRQHQARGSGAIPLQRGRADAEAHQQALAKGRRTCW